eukprot:TRINITY_DN441218_c0_g1_i1.p1 TRINITY_DN441218_c0_g1~~TRINITY_DN441218_c0_g1_i1.p1  ORF type:complete len:116 (+),score=13.11 TRINITY_DN441218_c0_g1_i1:25-348(+)
MAPRATKKTGDNLNARLKLVMKTGKYNLGFKSALRVLRSGKAKLLIIAKNTPPLKKSLLEYLCMLSKCSVHHFDGDNTELGTACGKYFRCGVLTIVSEGDSDILSTL